MERRSEKRANWLEYQLETMPLPAEWEELYDVKPQDLDTDPDIPKRTWERKSRDWRGRRRTAYWLYLAYTRTCGQSSEEQHG